MARMENGMLCVLLQMFYLHVVQAAVAHAPLVWMACAELVARELDVVGMGGRTLVMLRPVRALGRGAWTGS